MDPRKVRKIWQLIYDAFGFDIPVEAIKSKIYSRRGNQINQSRRWEITFWWSPCSLATLSCTWPPRDPPPSQGLRPSFTMSEGLQVVSQSLGRALIDLDDPGWTWEDEYLLTSNALWASPSAAEKPLCKGAITIVSKVSPNFRCLVLRNSTVLLNGRH